MSVNGAAEKYKDRLSLTNARNTLHNSECTEKLKTNKVDAQCDKLATKLS